MKVCGYPGDTDVIPLRIRRVPRGRREEGGQRRRFSSANQGSFDRKLWKANVRPELYATLLAQSRAFQS